MSYDYPDGYVPPPRERGLRVWLVDRYYGFIIWCALDAPFEFLRNWGLDRLVGRKEKA